MLRGRGSNHLHRGIYLDMGSFIIEAEGFNARGSGPTQKAFSRSGWGLVFSLKLTREFLIIGGPYRPVGISTTDHKARLKKLPYCPRCTSDC